MSRKIVIISGPDNVGKTTQIKLLHDYFANQNIGKSTHILHYSNVRLKSSSEIQTYSANLYRDGFNLMKNSPNVNFICDRFHDGEWVYGKLYRNYDAEYIYGIEELFNVDETFWTEIYLITFIDKPGNLINRDDGESFSIDFDMKSKEINRFRDFHKKSVILNKKLINICRMDIDAVHKKVIQFIEGKIK